jgi:AcrR family transcriptional regulator
LIECQDRETGCGNRADWCVAVVVSQRYSSKIERQTRNSYWHKKREKILSAAARFFWERGYLGTTMDDIAGATRLNKASIYYYFPSKADILFALAVRPGMEILAKARRLCDNGLPPEDKLRLLITNHLKWHTSHRRVVSIENSESRYLPSKLLKRYISVRDQYEAIYRDVIAQGIDKGSFRPISPKIGSLFTLGLVNWILRWFKPRGELSTIGNCRTRFRLCV